MSDKIKITIEDEVFCKLEDVPKEVMNYFRDFYKTRPKNYRFNPAFKLGKWDGYIYRFTADGKTYTKLLPEIVEAIYSLGLKAKLVDKRIVKNIPELTIDENYLNVDRPDVTLGDHQVKAVNALLEANGGVLRAGTGAGKTFICAALCKRYEALGMRCFIIVPTGDLVIQTAQEIKSFGYEVGRINKDYKETNTKHICSTWQSLMNMPELLSMFDVIILDECHTVSGPELQKIITERTNHMPIKIAMTGTLPDNDCDKLALRSLFGEVQYEIPAIDLINLGWLAELRLKTIILEEDFKDRYAAFVAAHPELEADTPYKTFKDEYFPDYASEYAFISKNRRRLSFISALIQSYQFKDVQKMNSLVLVQSVEAGKYISSKIPNSAFIYGKDASKVRKKIYDAFANNDDLTVVTTFKLASTGINIPRIFHVFLVDANKSFTQIIQTIGRGLRRAHDKDGVTAYDISSDLKFASRHRGKRKGFYKDEGFKLDKQIKIDYSKLANTEDFEDGNS